MAYENYGAEKLTESQTFDRMLDSLSPSNQRLVRELIFQLQPRDPPGLSLDNFHPHEVVPEWLAYLLSENKSPVTMREYSLHLRLLLSQFPQPTRAYIDAHLASCRARGNGVSSINNKVSSFKSFFAFSYEKGYVSIDPASRLKSLKRPVRETKSPPRVDVERLLSLNLRLRDRAILYLFIDGGLRLNEARSIRIADIGQGEVTVIGKGDKQRTVPLSWPAISVITSLKAQLPLGEKYLFPGRFPGRCWNWRTIEYRLSALCLEAGIERITPHQLRHFYATYMLNHGANRNVVSQLLGHSSPSVTEDVYWHVDGGMKYHEHHLHSPLDALRINIRKGDKMTKKSKSRKTRGPDELPVQLAHPDLIYALDHPEKVKVQKSKPGVGDSIESIENIESIPPHPPPSDLDAPVHNLPPALYADPATREAIRRKLKVLKVASINKLLRTYSAPDLLESIADFERELDLGGKVRNPNGFIRWLLPSGAGANQQESYSSRHRKEMKHESSQRPLP